MVYRDEAGESEGVGQEDEDAETEIVGDSGPSIERGPIELAAIPALERRL